MNTQTVGACRIGQKWHNEAYLVLRVVTGLIFFYHGYMKVSVMGMENVVGFFATIGIPFASLLAYIVAYGELIGGVALILGLCTHWVAKLNVLIMLGAIYFVHFTNGFDNAQGGYEFQLILLAVNLFIITAGAGVYSLDARQASRKMVSSL